MDTSHFDEEFTDMPIESVPSSADLAPVSVVQDKFDGFSYVNPGELLPKAS